MASYTFKSQMSVNRGFRVNISEHTILITRDGQFLIDIILSLPQKEHYENIEYIEIKIGGINKLQISKNEINANIIHENSKHTLNIGEYFCSETNPLPTFLMPYHQVHLYIHMNKKIDTTDIILTCEFKSYFVPGVDIFRIPSVVEMIQKLVENGIHHSLVECNNNINFFELDNKIFIKNNNNNKIIKYCCLSEKINKAHDEHLDKLSSIKNMMLLYLIKNIVDIISQYQESSYILLDHDREPSIEKTNNIELNCIELYEIKSNLNKKNNIVLSAYSIIKSGMYY